MRLLVHGVGELHPWQLLLQEILHIGGILASDVSGRDDAGLDGSLLQKLRCARTCYNHLGETVLGEDGVEKSLIDNILLHLLCRGQ